MSAARISTDSVGAVGERAALARIIPRLPTGVATVLGPGDDAAVLAVADGRAVLTTDVMVEGPDFRTAWSTPEDLGRKAVATNFSDIAAMGAVPVALMIALAVPAPTPVPDLEAFADGVAAACRDLAPECGVVGGDLTVSPVFTIAVTAVGSLQGREPIRRDGARAGDVLAYSGRLGLAGAALHLLFARAVDEDGNPDVASAAALRAENPDALAAQLAPRPPIGDGPRAALAGATAMLDVSDGLLIDAGRIARASGVVLDLDATALSEHASAVAAALPDLGEEPMRFVLAGGEDHGLLACFPAEATLPGGFRLLGVVRAGEPEVRIDGVTPPSGRAGWDSFTA
ncbi:thiamine-phosphate kinase [uncultured Amnibacterium sp.]|uniref:thiamine-phosphate kinase n=1 Tax=uncultured Amnibacterium sp. TaxID=1631851 RepID=UPI0035CAB1A0